MKIHSDPTPDPGPASPGATALPLRVRYCECDPMGVAHHASFVPWLEMGRTELLRTKGVSYKSLESAGIFLVVTKLDVRYRRPVLYDDVVEVRTRVDEAGKVRIRHAYEVVVVERDGSAWEDQGPAALGTTELACVTAQGRLRAMPQWLVSA